MDNFYIKGFGFQKTANGRQMTDDKKQTAYDL